MATDKKAKLLAKQAEIQAELKRIEEEERKRASEREQRRILEVGRLAQKAGILDVNNQELMKYFTGIYESLR